MNNEFVAAARNYLGVKFKHQGRSRRGVDCVGLVICAARDIGFNLEPGILNYAPNPGMTFYEQIKLYPFVYEISEQEAATGDLILIKHMGMPIHVAIINHNCIIHAYQPTSWVCEHRIENKFKRRFHSYWRVDWSEAPRIV